MAKNTTGYFLSTQEYKQTTISTAGSATLLTTASVNDSWLYDVLVTTNSTDPVLGTLSIDNGSGAFNLKKILAASPIQPEQGTNTANPYRLIQSSDGSQVIYRFLDRDQNYYIPLPSGSSLYFTVDSGLSAGSSASLLTFLRSF